MGPANTCLSSSGPRQGAWALRRIFSFTGSFADGRAAASGWGWRERCSSSAGASLTERPQRRPSPGVHRVLPNPAGARLGWHRAQRTPDAAPGGPGPWPRSRGVVVAPGAHGRCGDPRAGLRKPAGRVPAVGTWRPGCPRSRGRRGSGWRAPGTPPPCRVAAVARGRPEGGVSALKSSAALSCAPLRPHAPGSAQALGSDARPPPSDLSAARNPRAPRCAGAEGGGEGRGAHRSRPQARHLPGDGRCSAHPDPSFPAGGRVCSLDLCLIRALSRHAFIHSLIYSLSGSFIPAESAARRGPSL